MDKNMDKLTEMVYDNKYKLSLYISFFLLTVFYIIDQFYHHQFMEASIQLSIKLQTINMDALMWFFSNVVFFGLFMLSVLFYTIRNNAETSFVQLFSIVLMMYAQGVLKMFFRRPRPVFLDERLRNVYCLCDYGMPSGHSLCTVGIMLIFYDEFTKIYKVRKPFKIAYILFSFLLTFSIILSRIYFGVHSFNQCIMGVLIGSTLFFFMKRMKDNFLKYLIWPIFQKELFRNKNSIAVLMFLWISMNYFAFVCWAYVFTMYEYPDINFPFKNCHHCNKPDKSFSSKTLKEILGFNLYFGMLLGVFLDKNKDFKYKGLYEDKNICKYLLRLLIFIIFLSFMVFTVYPLMLYRFSGFIRAMVISFITGFMITTVYFRVLEILGLGMKGIKRTTLKELYYKENLQNKTLEELSKDNDRNEKMLIESEHFLIDLQREKLDQKVLEQFQELFCKHVKPKIKEMHEGGCINVTEKQAALHFVLRHAEFSKEADETVKNVWREQQDCLQRIKNYSEKIRKSEIQNFDNKKFTDIVSVGIGGSSLGTECIYRALQHNPKYAKDEKNLNVHFLSNVDPASFVQITSSLNPKTTLVVMISKSFTTAETLQNGNLVKNWIIQSYDKQKTEQEIIAKHFVAISANKELCQQFGIEIDNVYPMWNQVGGRFSVSSAVGGLPISLAFSYDVFLDFLKGMEASDKNFFKEDNLLQNSACLMSMIDNFHNYTQEFSTKIIIPYSEALKRFPAHIQQVEMESIGKSYNISTHKLNEYFVGQFVFGEPGTNSQHSFFQSLHQARVSSIEFIGFSKPQVDDLEIDNKNCYNEFMANMFAQADAFALGKKNEESLWENFSGDRPSMVLLFKDELNAFNLGYLISLYENRCAASGFFADINTFDQYGVNLGKVLAKEISPCLMSDQNKEPKETQGISKGLIEYFNKNRYEK